MNLNKRVKTYNVTAKCFDGKIVHRTEEFKQIQFRNHPSVIVNDDGVKLNDALMIINSWNSHVGNTNYLYTLDV